MNTPTVSRPRWFCRVVRFWANLRGENPRAHARTCADCRAHFAAAEDFENRLRHDARSLEPAMPSGLEQRIMQSITPAVRARRAAPARGGWFLLAGAGAAACAALALAWVWIRQPDAPPLVAQEETPATVTTASTGVTWTLLSERLRESVAPATSTLTDQNPLQRELDFVYADTRSALRFLARNFLSEIPDALAPGDEAQATSS